MADRPPAPAEQVWDVTRPRQPSRLAGVMMAGFRDRGSTPVRHRLIPHPSVTLVLDFGARPPLVDDAHGVRHEGSLVAGLGPARAARVSGESIACVQVRLSPLVAGAVLGTRLGDLTGIVTLEQLWGAEAPLLRDQLATAGSWEERFALTDAALVRPGPARHTVDPEVRWAWGRIMASEGRLRVTELVAELGWSRKRLWSRFSAQVGLPPKQVARLVRFDRATHLLAAGQSAALVAADSGYHDQSHLHRDVVALAGVTPGGIPGEPFLAVDDIAWSPY